jgi:hypothetical protein
MMNYAVGNAVESLSTPSAKQRAVCKYVLSKVPSQDNTELTNHAIEGSPSDSYWVFSGHLRGAPHAFMTLSLPEFSNKAFLGVSDQCRDVFKHLVSDFNAKSECNNAVTAGYAELVKHAKLNRNGWSGVLVMEAQRLLKKLPPVSAVNGEAYEFLLVVPITALEYTIWYQAGYKALVHHFNMCGRSLFHFHQVLDEDTNRLVPVPAKKMHRARSSRATSVASSGCNQRKVETPLGGGTGGGEKRSAVRPAPLTQALSAKKTSSLKSVKIKCTTQATGLKSIEPAVGRPEPSKIDQATPSRGVLIASASALSAQKLTKRVFSVPDRNPSPAPGASRFGKALESSYKSVPRKSAQREPAALYDRELDIAHDPANADELVTRAAHHSKRLKRAVIESAVGTTLLVGGFVTTLFYVGSESPAMTVMPAVFTVAGLMTLACAFNDAISVSYDPALETVNIP